MTSVLVTGAGGFIGRSATAALEDAGFEVMPVARRPTPDIALGLDLGGSLAALPHADCVVHLAGGYAGAGLRELQDVDLAIADNLLTWGARAGVRTWVLASAAEVYGPCPEPVREDAPLAPVIPYGVVKREIEHLFAKVGTRHTEARVAILRIGEVYGSDGNLLDELSRRFRSGFCPWFGAGDVPISFVHVADVARVLAAGVERAPAGLSVWNVADDEPITWRTFLDAVAARLGARPAVGLPPSLSRLYAGVSTAWDRLWRRRPLVTRHIVTLLTTPKVLSNRKMHDELGVDLLYPGHGTGLDAALQGEEIAVHDGLPSR